MKQSVEISEFDAPDFVQKFILNWKKNKRYSDNSALTLGETIELLTAVTFTFYKDDSDGRFFNNSLQNDESAIQWDGEELIDILYYECIKLIKKRIGRSGTFNEVVDNGGQEA